MDEEHHEYYYFHRFKMRLYNAKNVSKELIIEDITGKSASALDIFSLSIKALKDHVLNSITQELVDVKMNDIRWVLTVPAIWILAHNNMAQQTAEDDKYLIVAAIDFELPILGMPFQPEMTSKNPLQIQANPVWHAGSRQLLSLKTPTCLLLDSDKNFVAFGYEAENEYAELVMDEEHHEYYYFHRFKMRLYNAKNVSKELIIEDITGKSASALDIFSLSIKALKDHVLNSITQELAGISSNRLRIALEPEAASIYCQHLPTKKLEGAKEFAVATVGTKYMVVDLGGGTVDITVHEKRNDGSLKESCRASGGDYGGTGVDQEFMKMMENITGTEAMKAFKRKSLTRTSTYQENLKTRKEICVLHDSSHLENVKGKQKCSRVFDLIVKRNEILPLGKTVTSTARCKQEDNGLFTLRIYQTERENPMYTDEDGCSVLGTITVQLTAGTGTDDKIKVELIFGILR
ncbi:unnamed protein product [Mytilus edulis]|uniref:Uncharacterized protein n=1 Tax=Mytilus edulis TaxID=6550 RepID=A0A8S3RHV4_MYTED|nr:unnamed protein product [Mytilus edulis]